MSAQEEAKFETEELAIHSLLWSSLVAPEQFSDLPTYSGSREPFSFHVFNIYFCH